MWGCDAGGRESARDASSSFCVGMNHYCIQVTHPERGKWTHEASRVEHGAFARVEDWVIYKKISYSPRVGLSFYREAKSATYLP